MRRATSRDDGSILVWTVLTIAVLSLVAAQVLRVVSAKYQNAVQTATWQEALLGAESGIDVAVMELRKSLYPPPTRAWDPAAGWTNTPGNGVVSYGITTVPNAGLAGTPMTVEVNVDAPAQLVDPSNGWQYYRVRTVGTLPLTGPNRANDNKQDTRLRKLSLTVERFTDGILQTRAFAAGEVAHVSRRTEAILRPVSAFDLAIMSVGALDLTDQNIIIDSYDSRDSAKSTGGLYDVNKRQENGDIATDGNILNAGNARVYGDVATNAGTVTGFANVTGQTRNDFYQDPIPVTAPSWPSVNPSPASGSISSNTTLTASSTDGAPLSRFRINSLAISGQDKLTLAAPNPNASPAPTSYIEIYVTGSFDASGQAQIVVEPGVKAKIYFGGTVTISGQGIVNSNNQPGDLLMYGITPPDGTPRSMQISGNAQLSAAVYAPAYDVQINNGGTKGSVYGSFVGKTVKMNGVTDLHYDEALGSGGAINSYKIVSWFEDTR